MSVSAKQKSIIAQNMKPAGKDFISKCGQICSFLQIWSQLLTKILYGRLNFFSLNMKLLFYLLCAKLCLLCTWKHDFMEYIG